MILSVAVELFFELEEGHDINWVKDEARRNPLEFWGDGALDEGDAVDKDGSEGGVAGMDTISCCSRL